MLDVLSSTILYHSIYLTRQFDVEDGTLVDKSTGKQVTTKARGNFVGLTFDSSLHNDGSGRLLEESWCHATYTMSDVQVDQTVFEFRSGTHLYYGAVNKNKNNKKKVVSKTKQPDDESGERDHGEVNFIAGHHSQQQIGPFLKNLEALPYEFPLGKSDEFPDGNPLLIEPFLATFDPILQSHPEAMCNIYADVVCTSGESQERCHFFMMCCGTEAQALFTDGNCCVVPHDTWSRRLNQGEWDQRRLGKCSQ